MQSRRGASSKIMWIAVTAILCFIVLSLLTTYVIGYKKGTFENIPDIACRESNHFKNLLGTKLKCLTPGTFQPLRICSIRDEKINSVDWEVDVCAQDETIQKLRYTDKSSAAKRCAAAQVLELARRCWWMAGEGKWSPCSFGCFIGMIELGETGVTAVSKQEVMAEYLKMSRAELGCEPYQNTLVKGTSSCDSVASTLAGHLVSRASYNAAFQYYSDIIGKGYLPNCNKTNYVVSDVLAEVVELKSADESSVRALLGSRVSENIEHCDDAFSKIAESLKGVKLYSQKMAAKDVDVFNLLTTHVGGDADQKTDLEAGDPSGLKYETAAERVSNIVNQTKGATSGVPDMSGIDGTYLNNLAKELVVPDSEETYSVALVDSVEMISYYELRPNEMFELAFCGGVHAGAGLANQVKCNVFDNQHIQMASIGGGAGGRTRGGSPYCNAASDMLPWIAGDAASALCEGVFWRASTTVQ